MNETPLLYLFIVLILLILLSGFFSSSETSMMSLNRYRLRHLAKRNHPGAIRASRLLEKTDQIISVILIGNNFVNILASAIATVIAIRLLGDAGVALATLVLTIVILIFAEVTPKTLAAYYPEKIAFPATLILEPLLKLLYPLVRIVNVFSSLLLRAAGINDRKPDTDHLTSDELRTVLNEAGGLIPKRHQDMLVSILDLERVSVNDIMIPRNEIVGINLSDPIETIIHHLRTASFTRLPVYRDDINNILGILHTRNAGRLLANQTFTKDDLLAICRAPYFVPESTPLNTQLVQFQQERRRIGIVVDEYGDILGLATLEDILEEIVGDFTTNLAATSPLVKTDNTLAFIVDGSTTIRSLNKQLNWSLPLEDAKTVNGLLVSALETIPEANLCLVIHDYRFETLLIRDHVIRSVRISRIPDQNNIPGQQRT